MSNVVLWLRPDVLCKADNTRAQHNASQLLLRLPDETKAQIWKLLCGTHLVHVSEADRDPEDQASKRHEFMSAKCYAKVSDEDIEQEFLADLDDRERIPTYAELHDHCSYDQNVWPEPIDLRWMRSCRQIYNESQQLPYSLYTFSFSKSSTLHSFVNHLARFDLHIRLRRIRLAVKCRRAEQESHDWAKAIRLMKKKCVNLDTMHVHWIQSIYSDLYFKLAPGTKNEDLPKAPLYQALLALTQSNLKRFTFVISESGSNQDNWSMEQKHKWALLVKKAVLKETSPSAKKIMPRQSEH